MAPTASLTATCTAPCNAPAAVSLSAATTVAAGRAVSKVEFYDGATKVGTDTTSPYSLALTGVIGGSHSYTAKVFDNAATPLTGTSAARVIAVNRPPTVTLVATCGTNPCAAPAVVTLSATPADPDGSISKVEFYRGSTKIATKTVAPWDHADSSLAVGTYGYTAKAFDNGAAPLSVTSTAQSITVVAASTAPTVSLVATCTAPCNALATVSLSATATVAAGRTVSKVEFYDGTTLLATDTTSPYSSTRISVAGGSHSYTAKVYDSAATPLTATSTATVIAVNVAPTVSLTVACNVTPCTAPATVTLAATPVDSDGIISKVEFYRDSTLLATRTVAPWTHDNVAVAAGNYSYTAKAFDNASTPLTAVSTAQSLVVSAPTAASVTLTATCPNNPCMVPMSADLVATPTVAPGRAVTRVEYYDGPQLLGETTVAPHVRSFVIEAAGVHSFTAKVYDNAVPSSVATSAPTALNFASMAIAVSCVEPCDTGQAITLTASDLHAPGATISRVEYFDTGTVYGQPNVATLIGEATSSPWTLNVENASWGQHAFSARAYDSSAPPRIVATATGAIQTVGAAVILQANCVAPCIEPATVTFSIDARYGESAYVTRAMLFDGQVLVNDTNWLGISNGGVPLWDRVLPYTETITGLRGGIHVLSATVDSAHYHDAATYRLGSATKSVTVAGPPTQNAALAPDGITTLVAAPAGADIVYKFSVQNDDQLSLLLENSFADDGATQVSYSLGPEFCSATSAQVPPEVGNLGLHANLLAYGPLRMAHCAAPTPIFLSSPDRQILNLSAFGATDVNVRLARANAPAAQSISATLMRHEQFTLLPNGPAATVAPTLRGRGQRYKFALAANQIVSIVQTQSGPFGYGVDFALVPPSQPDGFLDTIFPSGQAVVLRAGETGEYTMVAVQKSSVRGTATLAINTGTQLGSLQTDGTPLPWQPVRQGAIGVMTLNAAAGRTYTISAVSPLTSQNFTVFVDDPMGLSAPFTNGNLNGSAEFTPTRTGLHTFTFVATAVNPSMHNFVVLDGLPTIGFAQPSAVPACPGAPYSNTVVVTPSSYVDYVYVEQTRLGQPPSTSAIVNMSGTGPYAFAWTNYVSGGSYQLTATAVLRNGVRVTSLPVTVTFSTPIAIVDCALASGNFVTSDDQLSFTGDITGPRNASVFINNNRVPIDEQGRFIANNIPLSNGTNTINVLVAQLSGQQTLSYVVSRSNTPPFTVALTRETGIRPLTTTINVVNRAGAPWRRVSVLSDWGESETFVSTPASGDTLTVPLTIGIKGRFKIRIRVLGVNDAVLFETNRYVLVTLPEDDIALVTEAYVGMTEHLIAGSVPAALNHFTDESLPKFRALLTALAPSLPLFAGSSALVARNLGYCCSVTLYPSTAEALVTRYKDGRFYGFRVYLVRDLVDGLWRIHDM